jgi:hypothetical protein
MASMICAFFSSLMSFLRYSPGSALASGVCYSLLSLTAFTA